MNSEAVSITSLTKGSAGIQIRLERAPGDRQNGATTL